MILIKNGWIIEKDSLIKKDILIDNGIIVKIDDCLEENGIVLDAQGCVLMNGITDVHVHLREPGFTDKETVKTGTFAAAKGGVTSIMPMPNLKPCPDNLEHLKVELVALKKDAIVNAYPFGAVSVGEMGEEIADITEMKDVVFGLSDDGRGVNNLALLEEAMIKAKEYNLTIASHAEDNKWGLAPEGEYIAVVREIEMAKRIGCRYHFCHLSTKESFDAVRHAHLEGYKNITCEVTPHHLVLNQDDIVDANFKMNPPLRDRTDQLATIEALIDGTVAVLASDHAPHTEAEKSLEYQQCPNGILGLETMIPVIYTDFVKKGLISWSRFEDLLVNNPRDIFNLPKRQMQVGSIADISAFDIENDHTYNKEEILSKGKNSPFIGKTYYGFARYTLVNGQVVYQK